MFVRRLAPLTRGAQRVINCKYSSHVPTPAEIEKVPVQFRNITYDDVAIPRGSWQARYDELQKKNNAFLAFSLVVFSATLYSYVQTHDWVSCPDEPAERWYPLDRFKDGDGSPLL